jgi:flagellin
VSFSINTNIASLQARNNLRLNSDFQSKTIGRVTSGLRIVNSGDDAAGLAIANGYRSQEAVLTQGIRNANDGLSQLQTIDGGVNNISLLLDRARTLATQSASGSFSGDRAGLNAEFKSVLSEVDRQAQSIGLNSGGDFAKALQVFIGGGRGSTAANVAANSAVNVDLSHFAVDSKTLGLTGVQAAGTAGTDIGTGAKYTSVSSIVSDSNNTATEATGGFTSFSFSGPGFSDNYGNTAVKVSVNLGGVTDTSSLVNALNTAIATTGTGGTQQATAFKNANVTASITTDATGKQQLSFNSSTSAFQVQAGDAVSNALLGNFANTTSADGKAATAVATGSTAVATGASAAESVKIRLLGTGVTGTAGDLTVAIAGTESTAAALLTAVQTGLAANTTLKGLGVSASVDSNGKLAFTAAGGQSFDVLAAGDVNNFLGLGSYAASTGQAATSGNFDYNTLTAGAVGTVNKTTGLAISIEGGKNIDLGTFTGSGAATTDINALNTAIQANATLRSAGIIAVVNGTKVQLKSNGTANFRLNFYSTGAGTDGDALGFGAATATSTGTATPGSTSTVYAAKDTVNSSGAYQSVSAGTNVDVYQFSGLRYPNDAQTVSINAVDNSGVQHALNIGLTKSNASTLDGALNYINSQIQQSNDPILRGIAAVKEQNAAGTAEGIRFLSNSTAFGVSLGVTASGNGVADAAGNQGVYYKAALNGAGTTADISNQATAQSAVTALAEAVAALGKSQSAVGKGENQFTFAVNLAQSQLTNTTASESQIRDADLAAESANLTKAQILVQAGVAALAQANSAPQQLISLLQGR